MWNEIVKNEVWEYDNFLHEETVEHIKHQMFQSGSTELEPGEAIPVSYTHLTLPTICSV